MMGNNPGQGPTNFKMVGPVLPSGPEEVLKLQISNKNQDDESSQQSSNTLKNQKNSGVKPTVLEDEEMESSHRESSP